MQYETVNDWVKANGLHVKKFTAYHYAVYSDKIRVDIYPVNMRFHIVHHPDQKDERGQFPDELSDKIIFLETIFNL